MATPGTPFELTEKTKQQAIRYVEDSGFFKNRLAAFLGISRPTLDKVFDEEPDFFTQIKRADASFCKNLIAQVSKKNPVFILKTRYRDEFNEAFSPDFEPEAAIQKVKSILEENTTKELPPLIEPQ